MLVVDTERQFTVNKMEIYIAFLLQFVMAWI